MSVAAKREALAEMIERLEPIRVIFGKYGARIVKWTDTSDTLRREAALASADHAERPTKGTTSRPRLRALK